MFVSKYVQFRIVCLLQYSMNINTVEIDPLFRLTTKWRGEIARNIWLLKIFAKPSLQLQVIGMLN